MFGLRYMLCREKNDELYTAIRGKNSIGIVAKQNKFIYDKCYRIKNVRFIFV